MIDDLIRGIAQLHPDTAEHCKRVANHSLRLGCKLSLGGDDLKLLERSALLHDIGKTLIPVPILDHPDRLTPAQWTTLQQHSPLGERLVLQSALHDAPAISRLVRAHHEDFDGSGYPDGLKGSQIPLLARILSIVDCYDALTHTRSYRHALSHEETLGILRGEAPRKFDPEIWSVFETMPPLPG